MTVVWASGQSSGVNPPHVTKSGSGKERSRPLILASKVAQQTVIRIMDANGDDPREDEEMDDDLELQMALALSIAEVVRVCVSDYLSL